jgi:microsomal epoxide hydrolase
MPIFQLLKDKYTPDTLPYHIVVPSLPGYAFSSGPGLDKDFGIEDAARILDRLMLLFGFGDGYVAQGGDIGSLVARYLAATSPSCKGKIQSARSPH